MKREEELTVSVKAALRAYAEASKGQKCPICAGTESCDHTVKERLSAALIATPCGAPYGYVFGECTFLRNGSPLVTDYVINHSTPVFLQPTADVLLTTPKQGRVTVAYAYCCCGSTKYCDCVNPNHGTALMFRNEAGDDYPIVSEEKKPLNLEITKEWLEKQATKEGDLEIGVGFSVAPEYLPGFVSSTADRYYNGIIAKLQARITELDAKPKPEPVGWETEAEWQLEMRCCGITEATPFAEVSKLINDLWQQYCLAAEPKQVFADRHNDETGECETVDVEPEMVRKLRDRIEATEGWMDGDTTGAYVGKEASKRLTLRKATEGVDRQVHHSNPVASQNTQIVEDKAGEGVSDDNLAYNMGLEIRYAIAASGVDPIQHIPEVDAIIKRRIAEIRSLVEATEGGAHEKGIEAAAKVLDPRSFLEGAFYVKQSQDHARKVIEAYFAALTAKQTDGRGE